jgi:hypothetical protein
MTTIDEFLIKNNISPTLEIKNKKGESIFIYDLIEKYLKERTKLKDYEGKVNK